MISCENCKHKPVVDAGQYPCNECRRDTLPKFEAKVITRGNCVLCGKPLTEGLFFCKECESKRMDKDKE